MDKSLWAFQGQRGGWPARTSFRKNFGHRLVLCSSARNKNTTSSVCVMGQQPKFWGRAWSPVWSSLGQKWQSKRAVFLHPGVLEDNGIPTGSAAGDRDEPRLRKALPEPARGRLGSRGKAKPRSWRGHLCLQPPRLSPPPWGHGTRGQPGRKGPNTAALVGRD